MKTIYQFIYHPFCKVLGFALILTMFFTNGYAQQSCVGQPPLGNTISSANPVCPGQPFSLSLQGVSHQPGFSYEWIKSPDGTNWQPFATTNIPMLQPVIQLGNTFYACKVTCAGSQLTTGSIPVQVGMVQAIAQYPTREITVGPNESTEPSNTGEVTYSSPCCSTSHVTFSDVVELTCCKRIITRTWTIVECGGSTYTYVQIITQLLDVAPPVIVCNPLEGLLCNVIPTPSPTTVTVTDQCPVDLTVVTSSGPGNGLCETVYAFVWTATDQCGNQSSCTQTVTVINDLEPPVIHCPEPGFLPCNTVPTPSPTLISATDNCGTPVITLASTSESNVIDCFKFYFFHWKATDRCGNTATCVQSYKVKVDHDKPIIENCPDSIKVSNDPGLCGAVVTWIAPRIFDLCGFPTIEQTHHSGGFFPVGSTTVTYTATDDCGNVAICSFVVKVKDTEAPNTHCPDIIIKQNDRGFCDALVNYTLPATDNCGVASIVYNPALPAVLAIGFHDIEATVTDIHGNVSVCNFKIRVMDTEKPKIMGVPLNKTVNTDPGFCDALVFWPLASTTDNCGITSFVRVPAGNLFPKGSTTVTYTATDIYGNVSTDFFVITVVDNEGPVINNCPVDITRDNELNQCRARVTWVEPTATDNCGMVSFVRSHDPGQYFPVGLTNVTYTAKDARGNETVCTFKVRVKDTEKPRIVQADIVTCDSIVFYDPLFLDNCGISSPAVVPPSGSVFPIGTTPVFAETFDIYGNFKGIFFNVTRLARPKQQDTLLSSDMKICLGDSVQLMVTGGVKGAGGYYAYYELKSGLETYIDTGNYATVIPSDTGLHTYVARIEATCDSTAFDTVQVQVRPDFPGFPGGTHIWGDRYPCRPSLQGYKTHKIAGVSYVWTVPAGFSILDGQGRDSITVSVPASGTGQICVTACPVECGQCETWCISIGSALPAPVLSVVTGTYDGPQWIEISSTNVSGGLIYYTISGNIPVVGTSFTKLYAGPFQVLQTTTVRSIVVKPCLPVSAVAVAFVTISNPGIVATPVISPGSGSYTGPVHVTLSCTTPGASIYYALEGYLPRFDIPNSFTKLYISPFVLNKGTTIRAIALKTGLLNSGTAKADLSIIPGELVAKPAISPPGGLITGPTIITLSCTTPGATIYYTTNGNVPNTDIPNYFTKVYSIPFTIAGVTTVRAVGVRTGMLNSAVAVAYFTVPGARLAVNSELNNSEVKINIYPNPTFDKVKIMSGAGEMHLGVFNVMGTEVMRADIRSEDEISLRDFPAGLYLFRVGAGDLFREIKVLKR